MSEGLLVRVADLLGAMVELGTTQHLALVDNSVDNP